MTTEQWKKRWWQVRKQHQWQLLGEQKLWGAATSTPLTVHPFSHSEAKLHLPRFIAESGAGKHLVAWLWRGPHAVPKTIGKKTIIISYPVWRSATVQSCSSHYSYQQVHSRAMFKRRAHRLLPLKAWNTGNIYCKIRTSSLKKKLHKNKYKTKIPWHHEVWHNGSINFREHIVKLCYFWCPAIIRTTVASQIF